MNAMNLSVLNDLMLISAKTSDGQPRDTEASVGSIKFQALLNQMLDHRPSSDPPVLEDMGMKGINIGPRVEDRKTANLVYRENIPYGLQGGSRLIGGRPDEGASAPSISLREIQIIMKPFGNVRRLTSELRDIIVRSHLTPKDLYDLVEKIKDRVESEGAELREIVLTGINMSLSSSSDFTSIAPSGVKIGSSGSSAHHLTQQPRRGRPDEITYAHRPPNLTSREHMEAVVHIKDSQSPIPLYALTRPQKPGPPLGSPFSNLPHPGNGRFQSLMIHQGEYRGWRTISPDEHGLSVIPKLSEAKSIILGSPAHHPMYGSMGVREYRSEKDIPPPSHPYTPASRQMRKAVFKDAGVYPVPDPEIGFYIQPLETEALGGEIADVWAKTQISSIEDVTDLRLSFFDIFSEVKIIFSGSPPDRNIQPQGEMPDSEELKPQLNTNLLGEDILPEIQMGDREGQRRSDGDYAGITLILSHGEDQLSQPRRGRLEELAFVRRSADPDLLSSEDNSPAGEAKMREVGSLTAEEADRDGDNISSGSPAHHLVYESMSVRGYGGEKSAPSPSHPHALMPRHEVNVIVRFDDRGERVEVRGGDEGIIEDIARQWQHIGGPEYRLDIGDKLEPKIVSSELGEVISNEASRLEAEHPTLDRRVVTVSSIRVRLHPEHLGRMEIRVVKKGEEISAIIKVEDGSVRRMLHQIAPQIRQSLEEHGIKMGQVEVKSFNPSFSGGFGSWMGGEKGFQQPGYAGYPAVMSQNESSSYELEGEMQESSGVNLRA